MQLRDSSPPLTHPPATWDPALTAWSGFTKGNHETAQSTQWGASGGPPPGGSGRRESRFLAPALLVTFTMNESLGEGTFSFRGGDRC